MQPPGMDRASNFHQANEGYYIEHISNGFDKATTSSQENLSFKP
jgi:hypothetical protein